MNTSTQRMFISLQTYIYCCLLKSNCQTFNLPLLIVFHYIVYSTILYVRIRWVQILGFSSRYTKKNTLIQHARKFRLLSATQRKIHRKPALLFENTTNLYEIDFDHSAKSHHFETGRACEQVYILANKRTMYHNRLLRT